MPLDIYRSYGDGITVPYGPIFDQIRRNHGFTDLRGRPDLALKIFEGSSSQALSDLLVRMARERSYFSLGCDLGRHSEDEKPKKRSKVSGGYIQIASMNYAHTSTAQYDAFCDVFGRQLKRKAQTRRWSISLQGTFVQFNMPNEVPAKAPSMWIWFFAAAASHEKSDESREELLMAMGDVLHEHEVRECLGG